MKLTKQTLIKCSNKHCIDQQEVILEIFKPTACFNMGQMPSVSVNRPLECATRKCGICILSKFLQIASE